MKRSIQEGVAIECNDQIFGVQCISKRKMRLRGCDVLDFIYDCGKYKGELRVWFEGKDSFKGLSRRHGMEITLYFGIEVLNVYVTAEIAIGINAFDTLQVV